MLTEDKLLNLQKLCLAMAILTLPFDSIPKEYMISLIGGRLSVYFIIFGLLSCIFEYFKFKFDFLNYKKFILYIIVFMLWQSFSLVYGIINYPFEEFLQSFDGGKFDVLVDKFPNIDVLIDKITLVKIYLFLRLLINLVIIPTITYWGFAFLIYHIYQKEPQNIFYLVRKYVRYLVIICGLYSLLEIAYLKFNSEIAVQILKFINPYFYDIAFGHGWWPPLIWKNQLRSLCTEPSFFGIVAAFCIPYLWSYIYGKTGIKNFLLVCYFTFLIFLTRARTATLLYFGEVFLLYSIVIFDNVKKMYKSIAIITISVLLGFSLNVIEYNTIISFFKTSVIFSEQAEVYKSIDLRKADIKIYQEENVVKNNTDNQNKTENTKEYLKNNVFSILDKNARSNEARFINLSANLRVEADNPIFGVGNGLKNAYIAEALTEDDLKNAEVANWHTTTYEVGPFKSEFPVVNNFANFLVNNGIIGLILWLLPIGYIMLLISKNYKILVSEYTFTFSAISFCGCIAAMFSNAVWPTYYIALGVLLSVIEFLIKSKSEKQEKF